MEYKKLKEQLERLTEDVDLENETSQTNDNLRVFQRAYMGLEELQIWLEDNVVSPSGKMDKETEMFYDKLQDMVNEIYSRSLAFEE